MVKREDEPASGTVTHDARVLADDTPDRSTSPPLAGPPTRDTALLVPAILNRVLERYPWAVLDARKVTELPAYDMPRGEWQVTAGHRGRLPGPWESDLYVIAYALWNRAGRPADGRVTVRTADLLRYTKRGDGGKQWRLLVDALTCLESVHIRARLTTEHGRDRDVTYRLLFKHDVVDGGLTLLHLDPSLCASVATMGRRLDTERYMSFDRYTTRRMYRYLDYRRYRGSTPQAEAEFDLREVGAEIPVLQTEPGKIRRVLDPAHEELAADGFLRDVGYEKSGREWRVSYRFGGPAGAPGPVSAPPSRATDVADRVERAVRELDDPQSAAFYAGAIRDLGPDQFDHMLGSVLDDVAAQKLTRASARTFLAAAIRRRTAPPR